MPRSIIPLFRPGIRRDDRFRSRTALAEQRLETLILSISTLRASLTEFGIVLRGGPYQTQRWETAYGMADAALKRSDGVTIFLYMDGVYNALAPQDFESMKKLPKDHVESLLDQGAKIFACLTCTDNRGLEDGRAYLKRVQLTGSTEAGEMVSKCDRIINL